MTATQPWSIAAPPAPAPRRNAPATAGLWLGVLGLVLGFLPIVGLLVTIPAAALGHAGRTRFRTGRAATPGRSGAAMVLGGIGTTVCVLMSVFAIVGAAHAPAPLPAAAPVAAPVAPPAPVLLPVPNVVGMTDAQARDTLRTAGFTHLVLGPSTGAQAGVPEGTVTTQLPAAAAQASAGDPIVLGEAAAPPAPPVVAPAPAATTAEPTTEAAPAPLVRAEPDVDRHATPAAPRHLAATGSSGSSGASSGSGVSSGSGSSGSSESSGGSAYYANCTAARAAGAAPVRVGDPGYSRKLDRDGDGVGCE